MTQPLVRYNNPLVFAVLFKTQLALLGQHVPNLRHFLKFLFVKSVHQRCGKLAAILSVSAEFQHSLHDGVVPSRLTWRQLAQSYNERSPVDCVTGASLSACRAQTKTGIAAA
jgi:hypothetical protein